jgi:O-antigen/teichoic acid export membrane protein
MDKELGPIEEYLRELRASLRTPADLTSRILVEAEDHLKDSVAAGLAAGLTETEAAEAAISSFGSVRAVVRAHETRRGRAAVALGDLTVTAGVVLLLVFAVAMLAVVVGLAIGPHHAGPARPDNGGPASTVVFVVACGPAGLVVLGCYFLVSRLRRRGRSAAAPFDGSGTTAGIVIFGATFVVLSLLNALGLSFPGAVPAGIVSLGMIVGCAVRMFRRLPSTE